MTKFVWVWCQILVFSPGIRVNLSLMMKLPGKESMTVEFLLEDLSLGR